MLPMETGPTHFLQQEVVYFGYFTLQVKIILDIFFSRSHKFVKQGSMTIQQIAQVIHQYIDISDSLLTPYHINGPI